MMPASSTKAKRGENKNSSRKRPKNKETDREKGKRKPNKKGERERTLMARFLRTNLHANF
jgi:hypothetical protein